jgi:hypothetical protein
VANKTPDMRTMLNEAKAFLNEAQVDTLVKKFIKVIKGHASETKHGDPMAVDAMLYAIEHEAKKLGYDVDLQKRSAHGTTYVDYLAGEHEDGSAFEHNANESFITIVYADGNTKNLDIVKGKLK